MNGKDHCDSKDVPFGRGGWLRIFKTIMIFIIIDINSMPNFCIGKVMVMICRAMNKTNYKL